MSKKQPPQRQKRGISLGPVYQIRTPSFNFEEAAKYQVFIEDEIGKDLYQQYARQQPKSNQQAVDNDEEQKEIFG